MLTESIKTAESAYHKSNDSLISYYNKPYNYSKLVSYMNSSFAKLLDVDFISKIFKAKKSLHILEKQFTVNSIQLEFCNSKAAIEEYKLLRTYRAEAIKYGMETESSIKAHIEFKMTDFNIAYEEFQTYRVAIDTIRDFFNKEARNVENLLSQGKALAYSGHKFSDETSLMGFDSERE